MDVEDIKKAIEFTNYEKGLASGFNLPADAILPLLLTLRDGGDWSYSGDRIKTVSILDKTTIYDDAKKSGYSLEEIYLFIDPEITHAEGEIHRLEKCGDVEMRMLVKRPYKIKVRCERIIKATVHPMLKEIKVAELSEKELSFEGSTAYDIAHEVEHLEHMEIKGESLWEFKIIPPEF